MSTLRAGAAVLLLILAATGLGQTPAGPGPKVDPVLLRLEMMDGSAVTGQAGLKALTVQTGFGTVKVPLDNLAGFTIGLEGHPEMAERVGTLLTQLTGGGVPGEAAKRELLTLGPAIRPALEQRLQDQTPEQHTRIKEVLRELDTWAASHRDAPAWALTPMRRQDEVRAGPSIIVGRITDKSFTLGTHYGELQIRLSNVYRAEKASQSDVAPRATRREFLVLTLREGSRVKGKSTWTGVVMETPLGKVTIPTGLLESVNPGVDGKTAEVVLVNGDRFRGNLDLQAKIELQTAFGPLVIPLAQVAGIEVWSDDLADALKYHWSFDGADGNETRTRIKGQVEGAVTFEKGILGKAAAFRDPTMRISVDDETFTVHRWSEITVSAWVKMAQYTTYGPVLSRAVGNEASGFNLNVGGNYGGRWIAGNFSVLLEGEKSLSVSPTTFRAGVQEYPARDTWFHLVGVYDGTEIRCYVNGKFDGRAAAETRGLKIVDKPGARLGIGRSIQPAYDSWLDNYLHGSIDEVKVWKRALRASEVRELYEEALRQAKAR